MHKNCIFFLLLLLVSSTLHASPAKVITLNTTGNPPLNTKDGKGFMDQVAFEAFRRIGVELRTVHLPAERGLKNANLGIEDGEMSRIAGLDKHYRNLVQIPEKIMDWSFVGFSKNNIELNNGWSDLQKYHIAFINGWKILESHTKNYQFTKVKSVDLLFTLLTKNRTDIILYEKWGGLLIKSKLRNNDIKILSPSLADRPMYIYLHKKHQLLVIPLANALKELKADGSYRQYMSEILDPLLGSLK